MSGILAKIEECIPALRRYAWALLRDGQETDDLVQDCLVRALDRLETQRGDGDVRAWLFSILHNLSVSRWRRLRFRGRPAELKEESLPVGPGQEEGLRMRDLLRGLDQLKEEQRQVLLLVSVEGLSYAQVAAIQGVPVGTVMSRLSRARERLRQLTDEGAPVVPAYLRRVK